MVGGMRGLTNFAESTHDRCLDTKAVKRLLQHLSTLFRIIRHEQDALALRGPACQSRREGEGRGDLPLSLSKQIKHRCDARNKCRTRPEDAITVEEECAESVEQLGVIYHRGQGGGMFAA